MNRIEKPYKASRSEGRWVVTGSDERIVTSFADNARGRAEEMAECLNAAHAVGRRGGVDDGVRLASCADERLDTKEPLTVESVCKRLAFLAVKDGTGDYETGHYLEDNLLWKFILEVSEFPQNEATSPYPEMARLSAVASTLITWDRENKERTRHCA